MSDGTYRSLDTWQQAMDLVLKCYERTRKFPESERYGLTSQIRRAALSIPANIAEGWCRKTTRAYAHHVSIALGSHGELETCLELARRLTYLSEEEAKSVFDTCQRTGQLLTRLHQALERKLLSDQ